MAIVREVRAHGTVDIAGRRKSLGIVRPYDGTLREVRGGTPGQPLHGNGLNLHPFARANEWEVGLDGRSRKMGVKCFDILQLVGLRENVDLSSHLADVYLEFGKVTEDRCELGLDEMINGIERRESGGLAQEPPQVWCFHLQS